MAVSRRDAIKGLAGVAVAGLVSDSVDAKERVVEVSISSIKHSVCRWPYGRKSLEELCEAAIDIGISSVELINPADYETVKRYGLTCAMVNCVPLSLTDGFNNPNLHKKLQQEYLDLFPLVADAGFTNVICFSGNRNGISDDQGLEHCAVGLEPVVKKAQEYGLTVCMELLNSKVDHADYQCDHTEWGVALCEKLGLPNFKLLYDIYHMQIMEGDIIATIRKYHPYIAHYHTGGVPGRNEIDETQELNYKAIMQAIVETGYDGYIAQEFIPTNDNVFASLRQGVEICNV
ncbi:MAG: TIM barrel protein [Balneolaceae bacterium]|nr:TIM barrel protein [Balneolaceae bacterium]